MQKVFQDLLVALDALIDGKFQFGGTSVLVWSDIRYSITESVAIVEQNGFV